MGDGKGGWVGVEGGVGGGEGEERKWTPPERLNPATGLHRSDHITDALASLHWLRVPGRITYKTTLQTFRALRGEAPQYLSEKLVRIADNSSRRRCDLLQRRS